jgi:hypothetical protein
MLQDKTPHPKLAPNDRTPFIRPPHRRNRLPDSQFSFSAIAEDAIKDSGKVFSFRRSQRMKKFHPPSQRSRKTLSHARAE